MTTDFYIVQNTIIWNDLTSKGFATCGIRLETWPEAAVIRDLMTKSAAFQFRVVEPGKVHAYLTMPIEKRKGLRSHVYKMVEERLNELVDTVCSSKRVIDGESYANELCRYYNIDSVDKERSLRLSLPELYATTDCGIRINDTYKNLLVTDDSLERIFEMAPIPGLVVNCNVNKTTAVLIVEAGDSSELARKTQDAKRNLHAAHKSYYELSCQRAKRMYAEFLPGYSNGVGDGNT